MLSTGAYTAISARRSVVPWTLSMLGIRLSRWMESNALLSAQPWSMPGCSTMRAASSPRYRTDVDDGSGGQVVHQLRLLISRSSHAAGVAVFEAGTGQGHAGSLFQKRPQAWKLREVR
jgi:hypothetical protein